MTARLLFVWLRHGAALLGLVVIARVAGTTCMAQSWSFDLRKTSVHEAWIGNDAVYLRLPNAGRTDLDDIAPTPGLPLLTYANEQGFQPDPAIAAIDLATGKLRWARGYAGDYLFVLDPRGKDFWAMSRKFERLDSATGKTIETVPFDPRATDDERETNDAFRTINGLRINGKVSWGGTRFGRDVHDPVRIYDLETKEVTGVIAVNAVLPNRLQQVDLAVDQSPELVQTHVQMRPIGGGNAIWRFSSGGYSGNRPVMLGGDVLALTGMPDTVALVARLDGKTGDPKWVTHLPRGAFAVNQAQLKDGWYGVETWSAVGGLNEKLIFAIGGDATIHLLSADRGAIVGSAKIDEVLLAPPKLLGESLVMVSENRIQSVPLATVLSGAPLPEAKERIDESQRLISAGKFDDAIALAKQATDASPMSLDAWRAVSRAAQGAGKTDEAVRANCRVLELSGEPVTPYLRDRLGLQARIETGALRAPLANLGLLIYAPSTDGLLYVIDPVGLSVVEMTPMKGDATWVRLRGNQLLRKGNDRRLEVLLTVPAPPPPPTRDDPLYSPMDEHGFDRILPELPVPREWTRGGEKVGTAVQIDGRWVRPVQGGGVWELVGQKIVVHESRLEGVDHWRPVRTSGRPLGCGKGGLFRLDDNFRPVEFMIDLRSAGTNFGIPKVLTVETDGASLACISDNPSKYPHVLTLSLRSADAKQVIREEAVLPPGRFDDLERESTRLFRLGDGYFYAGGELVWVPLDPKKSVWRFRANDDPAAPRVNVRNTPVDRSFGVPRLLDGRLYVGCRYGGVYVFDLAKITGQ